MGVIMAYKLVVDYGFMIGQIMDSVIKERDGLDKGLRSRQLAILATQLELTKAYADSLGRKEVINKE